MNYKLLLFVPIFLLSLVVTAQSNDWKVLAKKDVAYKHEEDVISLRGAEKDIRKFKIRCTQGTLKFKKAVITYSDDSEVEKKPKGTGVISKGMSSLAFTVDKNKTPTKITLTYEAVGNMVLTKRAKIELLGQE